MRNNSFNRHRYFTEAEKNSDEYLTGCIDDAIADLVREKKHLKTAYNYYNGVMDAEEFQYLETNYGIGNPTSIEFIPLVRKHVDALIGEHLGTKLKPRVTCKDKKTLDAIDKIKRKELNKLELDLLKTDFQTNLDYAINLISDPNALPPLPQASELDLTKRKLEFSKSFVSEYEISAQFVIKNLQQNKNFDLTEKRRQLMLDLLVAGENGYKIDIVHMGQAPKITVLNPKNLFYERNYNSPYLKHSPRIVYRKYMTRDQVLNRYGHLFEDKQDIDKLFSSTHYARYGDEANVTYVSAPDMIGLIAGVGIGIDDQDYDYENRYNYDLVPVYEVEWVTTNKITENGKTVFKQDRYKGTRIGEEIYAEMGLDEDVVRSIDNPYECTTSFNGICYSNRNGRPYSMVLATKNIQDKYNILHFWRDTMLANSGVKGSHMDVANLPDFLGNSPEERAMKAIGYKKQGINFINSAQENAGQSNTIFSGYDETLSGQSIEAIQFVIQQTEEVCSGITGVFRERLGNIEQRDAVTNVEVGIKTSSVITKQYTHAMDMITQDLLLDAVNLCKISYKDGLIGTVLLGEGGHKIFTINPKYFSFTDYDIHIGDSSEINQQIQEIKALCMELVRGGVVDVDIIMDAITTESLTDMRDKVQAAFAKKTEEGGAISQLQQQLEQLQQQLQQTTQEAQKLQQENTNLKRTDREFEQNKLAREYEVKKQVADSNSDFNSKKIDLDLKRIELEKLQLTDSNTENDEVKNF